MMPQNGRYQEGPGAEFAMRRHGIGDVGVRHDWGH
jgi:hypothetical protein